MHEEPTTAAVRRYLDALPANSDVEPIIRNLLERAGLPITFFARHAPAPKLPTTNATAAQSRNRRPTG